MSELETWQIRDLAFEIAAKLRATEEEQWSTDVRNCLRALTPEITRRLERGIDTDGIPKLAMRWADDIALGRRSRRDLGKQEEAEREHNAVAQGTDNVARGAQ